VTTIGDTDPSGGTDPLEGGDPDDGSNGTVYVTSGRCIETIGGSCTSHPDCPDGTFCDGGTCKRAQGVCVVPADCPLDPAIACEPDPIVPASRDSDGDGLPDHLDNCVRTPNADQLDTDQDLVGDACDQEVCGNDVVEVYELCDGVEDERCAGSCLPDCTCDACGHASIGGSKDSVKVVTRNGKGQLNAKLAIDLGTYVNEPVTVRLDDTVASGIVVSRLVLLPPAGKSGKLWRFKSKADGLQLVQLKKLKTPGEFQLVIKAKRLFTTAADTAANTRLTVTIGGQCFTHTVTKKVD
jgi:hypothetical protein